MSDLTLVSCSISRIFSYTTRSSQGYDFGIVESFKAYNLVVYKMITEKTRFLLSQWMISCKYMTNKDGKQAVMDKKAINKHATLRNGFLSTIHPFCS